MSLPRGDEYWALWAEEYVRLAQGKQYPVVAMGERLGRDQKSVSTTVFRLRKRGFLAPIGEGESSRAAPRLSEKSKRIVEEVRLREQPVSFEAGIYAKSKEEALAEVWDIVVQLEAWDPKKGPFVFNAARMRNLGRDTNAEGDQP